MVGTVMPVTIICGKCEKEWSGDKTSSRVCPECGNDGEIESHVSREDARTVVGYHADRPVSEALRVGTER